MKLQKIIMEKYRLNNIVETLKKLSGTDFTIKSSKQELVFLRWIYFKIARETTNCSLSVIGKFINKDHATVLHGLKNVDDILKDLHLNNICKKCLKDLNYCDDIFHAIDGNYIINSKFIDYMDNIMIIEDVVDVLVYKESEKEIEQFKTPQNINDILQELNTEQLAELYETRLKPFLRMHKAA